MDVVCVVVKVLVDVLVSVVESVDVDVDVSVDVPVLVELLVSVVVSVEVIVLVGEVKVRVNRDAEIEYSGLSATINWLDSMVKANKFARRSYWV